MSALTLPSCLITQPVQFEPPTGFPSLIETPDTVMYRLDDIIRLTTDPSQTTIQDFEFDIRDPDVDETLEYQVYIDYVADEGRRADYSASVPPIDRSAGQDRTRRHVRFPLPRARLDSPRCHRIELLVSSAFAIQSREPVHEGDLGTAIWWVATSETPDSLVDMVSCP